MSMYLIEVLKIVISPKVDTLVLLFPRQVSALLQFEQRRTIIKLNLLKAVFIAPHSSRKGTNTFKYQVVVLHTLLQNTE